jgi:ABC-type nitrate/sulfonate/bicarbonate transport system permease component
VPAMRSSEPGGQRARRDPLAARAFWWRLAVVVGIVAVWQLVAGVGLVSDTYVASPAQVASALADLAGDEAARSAFEQTAWSVVTAFVFGTAAGLIVGFGLGLSKLLRKAYLGPVLYLLATPKSIFLPVLILLMGISWFSSAVFGAISAFFYVVVSVIGGVDLVEERHLRVARAFGARRFHRLRDVVIPAAQPGLFAALWQGVNHAFGGVMLAELFASRGGIGQLIRLYANNFQPAYVFAVIAVVSAAAIVAGSAWGRVEARMTRWRGTRGTATTQALA